MPWKVYDYSCPECGYRIEQELVKEEDKDNITCACGLLMQREHPATTMFTTIVPTYPGAQEHKAGYVHKHTKRPATKVQIGYGGGVSPDHPKGHRTK